VSDEPRSLVRRGERAGWRPPSRRTFLAVIGAAAAAIAARGRAIPGAGLAGDEPPRRTWTGKTRWIGHC
jgi:hypothetical protein